MEDNPQTKFSGEGQKTEKNRNWCLQFGAYNFGTEKFLHA